MKLQNTRTWILIKLKAKMKLCVFMKFDACLAVAVLQQTFSSHILT